MGYLPSLWFNDIEPYVCEWLRNLYPEATVVCDDFRNIEVPAATRQHYFAGIGGWEYALQLAGWPDNVPVWTASLPCQPFSTAGKRKGILDDRHLWPGFAHLIDQSRPNVIFGEQVASKDGREWIAGIQADLEGMGYIFGAADICAAGVGAPHIRQRLYWVAYAISGVSQRQFQLAGATREDQGGEEERQRLWSNAGDGESVGGMAYPSSIQGDSAFRSGEHSQSSDTGQLQGPEGLREAGRLAYSQCFASEPRRFTSESREGSGAPRAGAYVEPGRRSDTSRLGDSHSPRSQGWHGQPGKRTSQLAPWAASSIIYCQDGVYRRIPAEPGLFPVADGVPARVHKIRAAGGSIVPQVAATFISAFLEVMQDTV